MCKIEVAETADAKQESVTIRDEDAEPCIFEVDEKGRSSIKRMQWLNYSKRGLRHP